MFFASTVLGIVQVVTNRYWRHWYKWH